MRYIKRLQDSIHSLFYAHGLFCASHPIAIISIVITVFLVTCYPLIRLQLPGNVPLEYSTPLDGYTVPPASAATPDSGSTEGRKLEDQDKARWYMDVPAGYIQQIIVKAVVSPWDVRRMIQTDAFRAPLSKAFDIVQLINAFQYKSNDSVGMSISDVCLHVHETVRSKKVHGLVPEYNCLIVSPANLWGMDRAKFDSDPAVMKTVFRQYGPVLDSPPSIRDVLFGVSMKDSGIKRFFIRNRQRVISFAVTLIFEKYNKGYMSALKKKLESVYPDVVTSNVSAGRERNSEAERIDHLFFKDINYFVEYTPLMVVYVFAFLYLYFSVLKFDMVKSKWGLAFAAVMTVLASLLMSVGICAFFGMTPGLHGWNFGEKFPYLVVAIGVENIVVVTTSVVTTPVHLDVKLRVAQGISKEGWRIFKTFMTWMLILLCGFLTFSPAIQEFCLVAVVALLSDFFLQLFFFLSVLSIDIRRMELSDLQRKSVQLAIHEESTAKQEDINSKQQPKTSMSNNISHPNQPRDNRPSVENIGASLSSSSSRRSSSPPPSPPTGSPKEHNIFFPSHMWRTPRRVRLFNFWARYRVAQRGMMVCMVIWIMLILHKAGIVEHMFHVGMSWANISSYAYPAVYSKKSHNNLLKEPSAAHNHPHEIPDNIVPPEPYMYNGERDEKANELLQHSKGGQEWRNLYYMHFPTLFSYYNISLRGKYISILPSIYVSMVISPEESLSMRHPEEFRSSPHLFESKNQNLQSEATRHHDDQEDDHHDSDHHSDLLSPQTDPHDPNLTLLGSPTGKPLNLTMVLNKLVRYPQTQKEYVVTVLLGIASLVVFTYFMTMCYKCMCSRNYHKWRTSWARNKRRNRQARYYKQIRDAVPFVLQGHQQEVECLTTDGPLVVSSCLGGEIHVWDSMCGERLTVIKRTGWSPVTPRNPIPGRNINDSDADLYAEYHEPGARFSGSGGKVSTPSSHNSLNSTPPDISHLKPLTAWDTQLEAAVSSEVSTGLTREGGNGVYRAIPITPPHLINNTSTPSGGRGVISREGGMEYPIMSRQFQNDVTSTPNSRVRHPQQHVRNKSADWNCFVDQVPDLSGTIDTDFSSMYKAQPSHRHHQQQQQYIITNRQQSHDKSRGIHSPPAATYQTPQNPLNQSLTSSQSQPVLYSEENVGPGGDPCGGYDFSKFKVCYQEHRQMLHEKNEYLRRRKLPSSRTRSRDEETFQMDEELFNLEEDSTNTGSSEDTGKGHRRSWSYGSFNSEAMPSLSHTKTLSLEDVSALNVAPPIWSIVCKDNLIVAAAADGRVEFWDGTTGNLKCIYHKVKIGATSVCFVSNKVIVGRLNGSVDFLELETFMNSNRPAPPLPTNFLQHRGQIKRVLSQPGLSSEMRSWDDEIHCTLISTNKAHQRAINLLQCEVGRVVTASQDHTLKVFRLEDQLCLFTLHGHKAAVTALHLDKVSPYAAASGSEDGTVRLWDMLTGTCIHKLQGHSSAVTALTCTEMYVVSTGLDDRLCIWERCKGHRIHWIQMDAGYCNSLAMITSNLMVTGGQGCLYMWDVSKGEVLRVVQLGEADNSVFIRQITAISNAVVCDYGNQLRVVHFPAVLETKSD